MLRMSLPVGTTIRASRAVKSSGHSKVCAHSFASTVPRLHSGSSVPPARILFSDISSDNLCDCRTQMMNVPLHERSIGSSGNWASTMDQGGCCAIDAISTGALPFSPLIGSPYQMQDDRTVLSSGISQGESVSKNGSSHPTIAILQSGPCRNYNTQNRKTHR